MPAISWDFFYGGGCGVRSIRHKLLAILRVREYEGGRKEGGGIFTPRRNQALAGKSRGRKACLVGEEEEEEKRRRRGGEEEEEGLSDH